MILSPAIRIIFLALDFMINYFEGKLNKYFYHLFNGYNVFKAIIDLKEG